MRHAWAILIILLGLVCWASYGTVGVGGNIGGTGKKTLKAQSSTSGPGPAAWTPLSIASLRAWGDCSDNTKVTTSAGKVVTVTDKSTNAYAFTQANGTLQPTQGVAVQNGLNTCQYSPYNGQFRLSVDASNPVTVPAATLNVFTVCFLAKPNGAQQQFSALITSSAAGTANSLTFEVGAGANTMDIWYSAVGARAASAAVLVTNTWGMPCITSDNTIPLATNYYNNVSKGTTNQASGFLKLNNINIGADNAANFFNWAGDIGEWVIATTVLDATTLGQLRTYWINKWAVTL